MSLDDNPEVAAIEYAIATKNEYKDPLTGLFNRRYFSDPKEMDLLLGRNRSFGLIFLDIDNFKSINDTYGHAAGDDVIKDTANIIMMHTRGMDVAGRYGGEEFLIVMPDIDNIDELKLIAERLRQNFESNKINTNTIEINRTCSIGITVGQGKDGENGFESTVKKADGAMYKAKQGGRNRVEVA